MTIETVEFIRRFMLYVLPDGSIRTRHFDFLVNRCKKKALNRLRTS
jgi:hypothetical protein